MGIRLLPQTFRKQGVGFTLFHFGKFLDLGHLLVPQSDFTAYAKALQPEIDALLKEKPNLKGSVERIIQDIGSQMVVEAGPDLYVVNANSEVTEVIRIWMRDFKGSAERTK